MVEDLGSYAKKICLTKEAEIQNADFSLRGKGIRVWTYEESLRASGHPYLHIYMITAGPAFRVYVLCNQNVLSEIKSHTWMLGAVT